MFVVCDRLIADLTGAYGHRVVQTPSLGRLASEGVHFDTSCSTCPLYGPGRASLMTIRLGSYIDCFDNALFM